MGGQALSHGSIGPLVVYRQISFSLVESPRRISVLHRNTLCHSINVFLLRNSIKRFLISSCGLGLTGRNNALALCSGHACTLLWQVISFLMRIRELYGKCYGLEHWINYKTTVAVFIPEVSLLKEVVV